MKNRYGFTLVELLVTIVVLGIVTGISIPLIRNIRNGNEDKQYTTYMSSLKYSAKLYVDSYTEDLFGHEESGCAIIKYTDLEDKSLVNDISLSDVSCATEDTYIRVVKLGEKYGYSVSLGCGNKDSEGKVESITIKYPEEVISKDSCGIDVKTIMDFQTTPEKSDAVKYKRRNVTLTISSATGVHTGAEIQYGFSKDKGTTVEEGWNLLPLTITGEKKQKELIEGGTTILIDSDKLTTPAGLTGDYYLVLRIDKLQDVLGRAWTTDKDQSKYFYFGPYRVDNTPPTITNLKVDSTTTDYHNLSTKVTVTGSDNYSTGNNLKMCISESNNDCDASKYIKYVSSSQGFTVSGNYDGKIRTIYVHMKDAAGNVSKKFITYTVYKECTDLDLSCGSWGDWGSCSRVCGTGTKTRTRTCNNVDKYTNKVCSANTSESNTKDTASCNTTACVAKCQLTFDGTASGYDNDWYRSTGTVTISTTGTVGTVDIAKIREKNSDGTWPTSYTYTSISVRGQTKGRYFEGYVKTKEGKTATCSLTVKVDTEKPYICKYETPDGNQYLNNPRRFCLKLNRDLTSPNDGKTYVSRWGFAAKDDYSGLYYLKNMNCKKNKTDCKGYDGFRTVTNMSDEGIWWRHSSGYYDIILGDQAGNKSYFSNTIDDVNKTIYDHCWRGINSSITCVKDFGN